MATHFTVEPVSKVTDKFILPCDCAGHCTFLTIERFAEEVDGDPETWFWEFYESNPQQGIRDRIKGAWAVLRGDFTGRNSGAFTPNVRELRDWLNRQLPDA